MGEEVWIVVNLWRKVFIQDVYAGNVWFPIGGEKCSKRGDITFILDVLWTDFYMRRWTRWWRTDCVSIFVSVLPLDILKETSGWFPAVFVCVCSDQSQYFFLNLTKSQCFYNIKYILYNIIWALTKFQLTYGLQECTDIYSVADSNICYVQASD